MDPSIPKPRKGPGKLMTAIIAVVIAAIVVGSASYLYLDYFPNKVSPSISGTITATTGVPYYMNISTKPFKSLTVYFGDGASKTLTGGGTSIEVNHTYNMPGTAYVYYNETLSNGNSYNSGSSLLPVIVNPSSSYLDSKQSLGSLPYNATASSKTLVQGDTIVAPGSHISFAPSFNNEPVNTTWNVVKQQITEYKGASAVSNTTVPYAWNATAQTFSSSFLYNVSFSSAGLYTFKIDTTTAQFNNITGSTSATETSNAFTDVAVFNNGNVTQSGLKQSKSVFTIAENELGGYSGLDGAVYADSVSEEVMMNVYQHLLVYNGSQVQFEPQLAKAVPSTSNGLINTNYKNYTLTNPKGQSYTVHLQPYENYTFNIRSGETFQNGNSVTAWDVMYSLTRDMLFAADPPDTPGYIFAQNFLPGDFSKSNTFYNITQNITVNNQSQSITLHFGHPISPSLVFEILSAGGTYVMDANWLASHGAGITWSPSGFLKYQAEGAPAGYVPYVEQHAMANGPYQISYTIPGQEVVLTKNPNYVSPGAWAPAASINTIRILYVGEGSSRYLLINSGEAQSAGIPSANFNEVQQLQSQGKANTYFFSTITMFWYSFNANINMSMTGTIDKNINMPYNFFASQNVRKAFAYAFNYPLYYSQQVGNSIYNETFASPFAGMLPTGMPGAQTISDLNKTTDGVPYYSMAIAKQFWKYASSELTSMGITKDSKTGNYMFNGSTLEIPLIIDTGDPANQAGAATWQSNLESFITGANIVVVPMSFPDIVAFSTPGQDPMPLYYLGWEPDYPFPTDYVGPMENPTNTSLYMGADGMIPYTMQQFGNTSEAQALQGMASNYQSALSASNSSKQIAYFQKVNEQAVNMSLYVPMQQVHQYWVVSPSISSSSIKNYEENIMFGGGTIMLFYYLQYA